MSISAIVADVVFTFPGHSRNGSLRLEPVGNDPVGQKHLHFTTAPEWVEELKGQQIWGGADSIMYKEQEIATRKGYTTIVFTAKALHGLGPAAAAEMGVS